MEQIFVCKACVAGVPLDCTISVNIPTVSLQSCVSVALITYITLIL